jgi:peptidoglycan/xylan/chitin deacetylase (PgdA/CDA1 family)
MKIVVFNARRFLKYLLIMAAAAFVITAFSLTGMNVLGVFSDQREIPIYSVDVPDKAASITFDCAWGSDDIPGILASLKEADVRATFFIVGQWAEKYPDKVRMIAKDGHDIANHSYSHLRMGGMDRTKATGELKDCRNLLERLSGTKCELFRAPYGEYSDTLITEARQQGLYTIQWDVDSLDWRPGISQDEIINRINTKVNNGSIILFHNDTPHTAQILPSILSVLRNKGYSLLPVSKMIMRDNYYIDFEGRQKQKRTEEVNK